MTLLLTNDDGFGAKGLEALIHALSSHHDVKVIAPDINRSGVSHAFTMNAPLCLKEKAENQFTCSGTPADCVSIGLSSFFNQKIDAVISGINRGANIGTDILYSGTAAAARQASLYDVPGIAVSLESTHHTWNYEPLAQFVVDNLTELLSLCKKDVFVNINAANQEQYAGWELTEPSRRHYHDTITTIHAPDGHYYSFFKGGRIETPQIVNSDYHVVRQGLISVSRVYAQPVKAKE